MARTVTGAGEILDDDEIDDIRALVVAEAAARKRNQVTAVNAATARTRAMGDSDWRSAPAVTEFAHDVVTVVEARQRAQADVTNAQLARIITTVSGRTSTPARRVDVRKLRGIPHADAYGRTADYYRWLTSDEPDHTPREAQDLVLDRVAQIAEMDVTLAFRAQAHKVMSEKTVVRFYRRVIHPERSDSGTSCGLCIVATDRVYGKKDLLPIHFRCNCSVMPVTSDNRDAGLILNTQDLKDLYAQAGGNTMRKLKETRYTIHQHGELGPVLTYRGDRFRGPADVTQDTDPASGKRTPK